MKFILLALVEKTCVSPPPPPPPPTPQLAMIVMLHFEGTGSRRVWRARVHIDNNKRVLNTEGTMPEPSFAFYVTSIQPLPNIVF